MIENPPHRMTREQAAEYLGVRPQTLAVWATTRRYALPFFRVGRKAIYLRADLDAWLAERRTTAGEPLALA